MNEKERITVCKICPQCKKEQIVANVDAENYYRWKFKGDINIQDALPDKTNDEREILMTGICPDCWNALWKDCDGEG